MVAEPLQRALSPDVAALQGSKLLTVSDAAGCAFRVNGLSVVHLCALLISIGDKVKPHCGRLRKEIACAQIAGSAEDNKQDCIAAHNASIALENQSAIEKKMIKECRTDINRRDGTYPCGDGKQEACRYPRLCTVVLQREVQGCKGECYRGNLREQHGTLPPVVGISNIEQDGNESCAVVEKQFRNSRNNES